MTDNAKRLKGNTKWVQFTQYSVQSTDNITDGGQ